MTLMTRGSAQSVSEDPILDEATRVPRIKFGPVVVGEDHPVFDLSDFAVTVESSAISVEASWIPGSVKWVRAPDDLAVPLARLRIALKMAPDRTILYWRERAILLQGGPEGATTEIFVPLLEGGVARLKADGRLLAAIRVSPRLAKSTPLASRHGIDHSCSRWRLTLGGLDDVFASVNCRLILVGKVGSEAPLLEVRWAAGGATLPDGGSPALAADLRDGRPARTTLIAPDGSNRTVEISATVPPRWQRLRLAAGTGPYSLLSNAHAGNGASGAIMLYGNLRLRTEEDLTLRFFDAAVSQSPSATAFFNNFGTYFAYDVADVWDDRLRMIALLGVQSVTFAPRGLSHPAFSQGLFPQGFEMTYLDAFGFRNKRLTGGAFIQPTAIVDYHNFWIRFGGSWFYELNYIEWRAGDRRAQMSGVSVGMPFAQLF